MRVSKESIEIILISIFFVISCIHPIGLYLTLFISFYYLLKGRIGIFKLMFLLILRTIISPGLFFDISENQIFSLYKWIVIMGASVLIIISELLNKTKIDRIIILIISLSLYFMFSSLIFSSSILISFLKIISYILPLLAFYYSKDLIFSVNLKKWIYKILKVPLILSIILIFSDLGYLRNGIGFQGVFNNPNMLGIVTVLTLGVAITTIKNSATKLFVCLYCLILIFLTGSRTSLISMLILILIYFLYSGYSNRLKFLTFISFIIFAFVFNFTSLKTRFEQFLLKGQNSEEILASRNSQIENLNIGFDKSPIFGNGFGVPINPSNSITNNNVVEAGNLFIALVMFSGVVGLILYLLFIFFWIKSVNKENICMFLSTILISMGEMVLFSSNSIGLWCSLIWVLSLEKKEGNSL